MLLIGMAQVYHSRHVTEKWARISIVFQVSRLGTTYSQSQSA